MLVLKKINKKRFCKKRDLARKKIMQIDNRYFWDFKEGFNDLNY